ncbi:hypothetical protein [Halobaculum sp. EA56]|uniref:hypothetical protein n=1 Tax=Halobaculum sp. EA56 TaxID=3421648 RepID=UPI003EBBBF4D
MSLRRVGATAFGAGLLVCAVLLVAVGPIAASTDAACSGPLPLTGYRLLGVQSWPPTLTYTDGCNAITLRPSVLWSGVVAAGGLLLAAVGQALAE